MDEHKTCLKNTISKLFNMSKAVAEKDTAPSNCCYQLESTVMAASFITMNMCRVYNEGMCSWFTFSIILNSQLFTFMNTKFAVVYVYEYLMEVCLKQ